MRVQTIEMSVPVGRDTTDDEPIHAQEQSGDTEQFKQLISACEGAIRKRRHFAWTAKARAAQADQFERDIKGIVKRWASSMGDAVTTDRTARKQLRVRIYNDLMLFIRTVTADATSRSTRSRLIRYGSLGVLGLVFTTAAITAAIVGSLG